jgi:tRNA 2-thiouridine synthesizing protein A
MSETTHRLDARGLNCPLPILKTKKAIAALVQGEILEVTATDPSSVKDLDSFCSQTGHEMVTVRPDYPERRLI